MIMRTSALWGHDRRVVALLIVVSSVSSTSLFPLYMLYYVHQIYIAIDLAALIVLTQKLQCAHYCSQAVIANIGLFAQLLNRPSKSPLRVSMYYIYLCLFLVRLQPLLGCSTFVASTGFTQPAIISVAWAMLIIFNLLVILLTVVRVMFHCAFKPSYQSGTLLNMEHRQHQWISGG